MVVTAAVFWRRVRSDVEFMFEREFSELCDGCRTSRRDDDADDSKCSRLVEEGTDLAAVVVVVVEADRRVARVIRDGIWMVIMYSHK